MGNTVGANEASVRLYFAIRSARRRRDRGVLRGRHSPHRHDQSHVGIDLRQPFEERATGNIRIAHNARDDGRARRTDAYAAGGVHDCGDHRDA
jgi:hypothetical protein